MVGRHGTPSHLMHLNKKNYTKEEMRERAEKEVDINDDNIQPSQFLPEELHERFYFLVDEMKEWGILSNLDGDSLSRYILADHKYWDIQKALEDLDYDDPSFTKLTNLEAKYFNQTSTLADKLGLNMVSRMKLEKKKDETPQEEKSDEEVLFGDALRAVK